MCYMTCNFSFSLLCRPRLSSRVEHLVIPRPRAACCEFGERRQLAEALAWLKARLTRLALPIGEPALTLVRAAKDECARGAL